MKTEILAYTYAIRFLITGQIYYGVRYAKGCYPAELGVKYFSSSKTVKKLIEEHGLSNFSFEVRKTFSDPKQARDFETRLLQRVKVKTNPKFLNKHDNTYVKCYDHAGSKNPMYGKPAPNRGKAHKPETIEKMKTSHRANPTWSGKHLSDEHKQKIKEGQQGAKHRRFKGYYHTPYGVFESSRLAEHSQISYKAIQKWCDNPDSIITPSMVSWSPYLLQEHLGKTFRELGFWFEAC